MNKSEQDLDESIENLDGVDSLEVIDVYGVIDKDVERGIKGDNRNL